MLGFSLLILSITIHTIDSFYYRKPDLEPTGIQIKRDIKKKLIYEENQRSRAEHPPKPPPRRTPSPVRSQHLSVSSTSNGRSSFGFKLDDEESVSIGWVLFICLLTYFLFFRHWFWFLILLLLKIVKLGGSFYMFYTI